jgi:hypothetical protein
LDGREAFCILPVTYFRSNIALREISYFIFPKTLIARYGKGLTFATSICGDVKGKMSHAAYAAVIPLSFAQP